VDLTLLVERL
jgi:hypothetical protein